MTALTHSEAAERARLVRVLSYAVDLDFTGGSDVFRSATAVRFSCRSPAGATFIEIKPAVLHRAVLNGQDLDPATLDGNRLPLPNLRPDNELRVEADMPYSRTGEGMHYFTDPADGQTYLAAHCGLDNAQRIFAAFDQPDLKAALTVSAAAPPQWTVIGNGIGRLDPAEPGRWQFAATPPISSYLFTLVAGPYHSIRAEHRGIPFGLHCRQSVAEHLDEDAAEIFGITRACFDRYQEIFDEPYPFDSYDQAFVPELVAGAMENPGCVTFRDEFVFRSAVTPAERQTRGMVIAHEMAHMWFGDLVTMRWWDDVWLSESFAEYMGFQVLSEATAWTGTWTDFALTRKPRGYDADQRSSTHPIAPGPRDVPDTDAALSNYDDISYAKGASALRQLVAWLGRPAFLAGINDYFARHRLGNAALADLLDSLTRASGRDVADWARCWLHSTGVDTLRLAGPRIAGRPVAIDHAGTRPHRLAVGVYDHAPGYPARLVRRASVPVSVGADADHADLPLPAGPPPALLLLNEGDLSYCKVRFDPQSWATVTSSLSGLGDSLSRAVVWNAARDLVRDGELAGRDYLELGARHLPAETDTAILQSVLDFARFQIADRYLGSRQRGAGLLLISGTCRDLLTRTADGNADGLRLAALRGLIDSASSPGDVADLRAWLTAGRLPGGPDLDPGLRWRMLLRLTALGAAGQPQIEQQLERDASAAGLEGAARCRAAIPEHAAKQAAWATLFETASTGRTGTDESSSYLLTATATGFWQPGQAELLAGYVPRYFPAVVEAAARRGAAIARVLAQHGFPYYAADEATLRAGEQCLERDALTPALRRLLADQLDDLRRARDVTSAQQSLRATAQIADA